MAGDIADEVKPELVKQFRQAVLDLRKTPNLSDELFNRMGAVYAKVLPGYDPTLKTVPVESILSLDLRSSLSLTKHT